MAYDSNLLIVWTYPLSDFLYFYQFSAILYPNDYFQVSLLPAMLKCFYLYCPNSTFSSRPNSRATCPRKETQDPPARSGLPILDFLCCPLSTHVLCPALLEHVCLFYKTESLWTAGNVTNSIVSLTSEAGPCMSPVTHNRLLNKLNALV